MRITGFSIRNYKGVALAEVRGLDAVSSVFLSGKNGTGKSLILEALVSLWHGKLLIADRVGPWSDSASITVALSLTDHEFDKVAQWNAKEQPTSLESKDSYELGVDIYRVSDRAQYSAEDPVVSILRNRQFQRDNPFATFDYLPATRQMGAGASGSVDLSMFDTKRILADLDQSVEHEISFRNGAWLPDIGSYLVTLDYQKYLAERDGLAITDDFAIVVDAFAKATGKQIGRPRYDPEMGGSLVEVTLPAGPSHALEDLSSGEREMLGLMYFVRRLSAAGGVLLLDEPEKHLHPSLQAALFEATKDMADRAQIVVVTHSPNLIAAADADGLVEVLSPVDSVTNQLRRVSQDADRTELLGLLGIESSALLQKDLIVIVEGDDDASALKAVFPIELGRAHLVTAGGVEKVATLAKALSELPKQLPWIAIRDRDFLSEDSRRTAQLEQPELFIWSTRELENVLLDPDLIFAAATTVRDLTQSEVKSAVQEAVKPLIEDVVESLTLQELTQRYPSPKLQGRPSAKNRAMTGLLAESRAYKQRADDYTALAARHRAETQARWTEDWRELVDGKVALRAIHSKLGVFRDSNEFKRALLNQARTNPSARPAELSRLEQRLTDLVKS